MEKIRVIFHAKHGGVELRDMLKRRALAMCKTDLARQVLANEFARDKGKYWMPRKPMARAGLDEFSAAKSQRAR